MLSCSLPRLDFPLVVLDTVEAVDVSETPSKPPCNGGSSQGEMSDSAIASAAACASFPAGFEEYLNPDRPSSAARSSSSVMRRL